MCTFFHRIIERLKLESTSGVPLVQPLLRAGHLSVLSPFSIAAECSCPPFSCTLILVSTFTLPPFFVVSTRTGAVACSTEIMNVPLLKLHYAMCK